MTDAIERLPPQRIEAERSFLGSLLIDSDQASKVVDRVLPSDFYRHSHRIIWTAMRELFRVGEAIDFVTITALLERDGQLEEVGGEVYISGLANDVPSSFHVEHYGGIIRNVAEFRNVITACGLIASEAYDPGDRESGELVARAVKLIRDAVRPQLEYRALGAIVTDVFDDFGKHRSPGIPTPWVRLNALLGGLRRGDMIVIAGRPSVGKSAFMLELALKALYAGNNVGFFSLEMSEEQLVDRILARRMLVDSRVFRDPELNTQLNQLGEQIGQISELPLQIATPIGATIETISADARAMVDNDGVGMIVVDYLQLVRAKQTSGIKRHEIVRELSRSIKALALELDVPIVIGSQLNRDAAGRAVPDLENLSESDAIAADGDVVLMLAREFKTQNGRKVETGLVHCNLAKQRNGPTGYFKLRFDKEFGQFKELQGDHDAPRDW